MTFNLKRLPLGLLLLVGLFIFWLLSTRYPQERVARGLKGSADPYREFKNARSEAMRNGQVFSIIGIKYGLPPETVKNVLSDYERAAFLFDEGSPIFPGAKNTQEVILAISEKYSLDSKTIASMLIDESSLNRCPEGYEGPEEYEGAQEEEFSGR